MHWQTFFGWRWKGGGFDSWSNRYQVVTWIGNWLWKSKPSRYITNITANSAFHPSGVQINQAPAFLAGIKAWRFHLRQVAGNTVRSHMAGDAPQLCNGFLTKSYTTVTTFLTNTCLSGSNDVRGGKTKVTDLDVIVGRQENVDRLQVSVNHTLHHPMSVIIRVEKIND